MENLTKKERRGLKKLESEEKLKKERRVKLIKKIGLWIGTIAVVAVSIWGLIALVNNDSLPQKAINLPPISKNDIVWGIPEDAKVTLVEYADFQCPACRNYFPLIRQLEKDFGDKLLVVYRFFPLTQIHQNAMLSTQAAYAASKQNKFWEIHDVLYENQTLWANSSNAKDLFIEYAKKINLNVSQFINDLNSDATKKFVNNEENSAISIGVNATPTFFVNGNMIQNPQGTKAFKQIIQDALNKK